MSKSALRYLERESKTSHPLLNSDHIEASAKLERLKQEQEDLNELSALLAGKRTSESYLRRKVLPVLMPIYTINALLIGIGIPCLRQFIFTSIPVLFFVCRLAYWTSLRREYGRHFYPLRTLIGALLIPGWYKHHQD